jgi:O-antigen ligase
MRSTRPHHAKAPLRARLTFANLGWALVVATVAAIPLIYNPAAADVYRFPKELVLRAVAILLALLFALRLIYRGRVDVPWRTDRVYWIAAAALAWTAITTLFAQHRLISVFSLLWVATCVVFFVAAYALAADRSTLAAAAVVAPAVIGAITCFRQSELFREGGIFGNAHDAAVQLAVAGVAAAALAFGSHGKARWIYSGATVLIAIGLIGTRTFGAIGAFAAGIAVLLLLAVKRRRARMAIIGAAGVAIVVLLAWAPLRQRVLGQAGAIVRGDFDAAISGRTLPFLAALRMTRDHPLFGVGPGGFAREYFSYKLTIEDDFPRLARSSSSVYNFGQTHNDHLQTLAQTGLPGYAIAVAALVYLGLRSRDPRSTDERAELARLLALPLAVTIAVAGMAGFPQSLAAPMVTFLFLAALVLATPPPAGETPASQPAGRRRSRNAAVPAASSPPHGDRHH